MGWSQTASRLRLPDLDVRQVALSTPSTVQFANNLSNLSHLGGEHHQPERVSRELERIHHALETFSHGCIVCWALNDTTMPDHGITMCKHGTLSDPDYQNFVNLSLYPVGTCWGCGCPQKVSDDRSMNGCY